MRLRIAFMGGALALAAATASAALAIVGGAPDAGRHPYVGMVVNFPTGNASGGFELCSGFLVSPTVFVTAAHCFPGGAAGLTLVDLQEDALADVRLGGAGTSVPGTVTIHPGFRIGGNGPAFDHDDVAVVHLAAPVRAPRYAQLPGVGDDDGLPANQPVDTVGYGVQDAKAQSGFGSRRVGSQRLLPGGGATGDEFLKLSGGTVCSGDSGGPNLAAGTDSVLSIDSYSSSATCEAVEYSQRLDTPSVHAFLAGFLHS
jgi:hypothetical protein